MAISANRTVTPCAKRTDTASWYHRSRELLSIEPYRNLRAASPATKTSLPCRKHLVDEVLGGDLHTYPRPASQHARAYTAASSARSFICLTGPIERVGRSDSNGDKRQGVDLEHWAFKDSDPLFLCFCVFVLFLGHRKSDKHAHGEADYYC